MTLEVLLRDAIKLSEDTDTPQGAAADAVITAIQETPLRVEVYEKAELKAMDGLSIADVHVVLDALVEVLEGK